MTLGTAFTGLTFVPAVGTAMIIGRVMIVEFAGSEDSEVVKTTCVGLHQILDPEISLCPGVLAILCAF